jgi:hypothetical protein
MISPRPKAMAAAVAAFGSIAFDRERDFCLKELGLASSSMLAQLLEFFFSQFGKLFRDRDRDRDLDSDLSILY